MKIILGVLTIMAILGGPTTFVSAEARGHINLFLGQKSLKSSDWEPIDKQFEYGINGDFSLKPVPFNISLAYLHTKDDVRGVTGETTEFRFGVRKYVSDSINKFSLLFGAGLAKVTAKFSASGVSGRGLKNWFLWRGWYKLLLRKELPSRSKG